MTPPPSADQPLTQRLLALVQTLQFGWFSGHVVLIFATIQYFISYITLRYYNWWAQGSYRLAFFAAAVTYGVVVYKAYRARMRSGSRQANTPLVLVTDENVQYLAMALVWLLSRQIPLAMLPFAIYSIFHVATYFRTNLVPVISPSPRERTADGKPPPNALADSLGRFVKEYYDASMGFVALLEIATWVRVLLSFLTFSRGAIILFVAYTAFLRARYAQSGFMQSIVQQLTARVDATVANEGTPPAARQAWTTVKSVASQAVDATDMSRYFQQTEGPRAKKAQ
ncbi:MAG: hypothetical protein M1815_005872 [Lichina confinis]|nr:MAG: hypothetical protein M1815_005872 [Lichina confinis]